MKNIINEVIEREVTGIEYNKYVGTEEKFLERELTAAARRAFVAKPYDVSLKPLKKVKII